jgi:hypothetical protein
LSELANVVAALAHNAADWLSACARWWDRTSGPRVQKSQHSLTAGYECAYRSTWRANFLPSGF